MGRQEFNGPLDEMAKNIGTTLDVFCYMNIALAQCHQSKTGWYWAGWEWDEIEERPRMSRLGGGHNLGMTQGEWKELHEKWETDAINQALERKGKERGRGKPYHLNLTERERERIEERVKNDKMKTLGLYWRGHRFET